MSNAEKYEQAFIDCFELTREQLEGLCYQDHTWDSVGHMSLMSALEETFDILLDTEDIIDFSSFEKGKEILRKYDVEI